MKASRHSTYITKKDILVVAIIAAMSFVVEISLGLVLMPIFSGIPLIGGTLSAIPDAAIVFLGAYLVPRRGSILLFAVILLSLSTMTPSFGPPGLYKILIGIGLGLIFELVLLVSRSRYSYFFATALSFSASIPVTYVAWKLFALPGVDALRQQLPMLSGIYFILGFIGALLGYWLYQSRLSKIPRLRMIREGSY